MSQQDAAAFLGQLAADLDLAARVRNAMRDSLIPIAEGQGLPVSPADLDDAVTGSQKIRADFPFAWAPTMLEG